MDRSVRLRSLVLRELSSLLVTMRRNRKWKSSARDFQADRTNRAPFTLIAQLEEIRWKLTAPDSAAPASTAAGAETVLALDRGALIEPFLALVTSPETNGHITCLALSAVERLVVEGLLDPPSEIHDSAFASAASSASAPGSPVFDAAPIHSVVHALTHCRFEPSDSSRDEVVLARLLSLSRAVLFSRAGSFLSNRAVWRLLQNLYAVHSQLHMRGAGGGGEHYSQVLAEQAEETMVELVTRVALQVNEQIEREKEEIKDAQTRAAPSATPASVNVAAAHSFPTFAGSGGTLQIPSRLPHPAERSAQAYPPSHHMSPVTTTIPQSFENIPSSTAAAAPTVAAASRPVPPPAGASPPIASASSSSLPPLSCRTPLIFNSGSSTPGVLQHAYGLPVLRKVFELVASLCESVHTDLNVALKIDLVHGVHGEGTRQLEQEHAAATAAQAAAAAARAAEEAAAEEEERNDTANNTATDQTTAAPAVDPPLSPSPSSPLLTPAPPAATPAPSGGTEGPSASPPSASSAAAAAASSPFPPSTLPPYSSASYRCLLPISELSTLGFFALPLPGGAVSSNGGGHHHHSSSNSSLGQSLVSTLNSGMIGGGGSSSAAAADALSNWHKRCHLTLRLLDALLSTLGRNLLAAPELLGFMQDSFMKFLLKNTRTFSSLAGVGATGSSSGAGVGRDVASTFHLPLFSRSLALVQQALVLYRDALPAQMEIVVQSVYLRIIGIKLVAPAAPSAPGATTAAPGGVAGTPSKSSLGPSGSAGASAPLDPSLVSSLYELQECVLESLLDLLSSSWFLPELFVNFDANVHTANNLSEEIMKGIVRGIFPMVTTNGTSAATGAGGAAASEEAGEEGLLAASSVAASFAAAALAAGAPAHDGSGSPSLHHSSSDSSSGVGGGHGDHGGFTHNHFLALRCVVENLKWIKLRAEAAANGWDGAAAKTRPSYTAPQSPATGSRSTQQQQQHAWGPRSSSPGSGECPSPSPSPAFSTSSTATAAPPAPGSHASLSEIATWLQFMESWVRAQPAFSNAAAIAAAAAGTAPEGDTASQPENVARAGDASDLPNSLFRCLHAARLTKRLLRACIAQFNAAPTKDGLAGFQNSFGLLRDYATAKKEFRKASALSATQAREIDAFTRLLRCNSAFDKVAIGLFLAEPDAFSRHIRSRYCSNNFAFSGMTIDDSLRMFLEAFRLPLEAQQIDRMMQSFAETYFAQNPEQGGLADGDAVHTLAFSIIMLNTDLHNDLIKNKMTLAQFISNNRGINHGKNVSPILLKSLYYSIKFNEIKMSGSAAAAAAASEAGAAGGGEVNDALWSDVIAQSSRMWIAPHVSATPQQLQQGRRYIRLDASDAQSREETHRAVMHLIESPASIIPERLCRAIVPGCLPTCSSSLSSAVLPCLLPLYADYLLFSSFGSAALASVTVVFELFLAPYMVVRHESRTRREQEAARKRAAAKAAWEEQREREWREQAAAQAAALAAANASSSAGFSIQVSSVVAPDALAGPSILAASRQSSTDSEYCSVENSSSADEGGGEYDETAAQAQSREGSPAAAALHTSASYPARFPGASPAQSGISAATAAPAARANHSASYESLSAMHSHFSSPPPVVRSPLHEASLATSTSTSLVSVLYSSFDSLATLCALYPVRFQSLFDKVVQALARFIGLTSHRGIVAAMGASGPSGVGLGDLAPPMSRALVLGNKYAALQSFGSNAKATLVTRWLLQVFLHRPLLLEAVRASWNDILRIVLALFYLEVLPQPTLEPSAHESAVSDGDAASSAGHAVQDEEDSPDWILTNLEDFVAEWNEKFGAFVGSSSGGPNGAGGATPNRRALSAGKLRKDLLSCVPLPSQGHGSSRKFSSADRGGLSDSSGSSTSGGSGGGGGGLGSSLLGLFFSSSSPPPGQVVEAPFHKTVDMASHELSLRALVSSCNLPFILLEQSRALSLPALRGMLAHIMELSVIRGVAAQTWTPSPAARERIAAQRMAQRTAMVAERHRTNRPSMMHSSALSSDDGPSPTAAAAAAAAAAASSRGSVLASLGLFEFDVLDEGLYVDLGEEAHIAHTLATNPAASLANLSPAHELGMHLQSTPAAAAGHSGSGGLSPLCSDCGVLDYLSLPFELRRAIFLLDLATKITMENGARVERLWGPIRKWMMGIIQGTTTASTATNTGSTGSAPGSGTQPVLLVSAAIVSLLSILSHLFHKENMREDLMHTLRAIIGPSAMTTTATATGASLSGTSRLDYFLSHSDICMQLVTGVHLFLARHGDSLRSSHDWECILGFVRATADYPRAIFHGFALLWSLIKSNAGDEGSCPPAVTLHTFPLLLDTVLAFVRSRYASPRMALKAVEMLETMYAHLRTLLAASASAGKDGSGSGQGSSGSNSPRGGAAGLGPSHPFLAKMDSDAAIIFSPTMAPAGSGGLGGGSSASGAAPSVSSSPRLLLSHVWKSYCKPLLLAFRCVSACATDRVRVLYNTFHFLQRQRAQQEQAAAAAAASSGSIGFGLLRASPPPPVAQPAAVQGPPVPLSDYVHYMVEWSRVRHQCLLLLKSTLVNDEFAASVSECVAQFGVQHGPALKAAAAASSSSPIALTPSSSASAASQSWDSSSSAISSWCCACFWQLCLDEVLFPLLRDLSVSASQALFLETSAPFSLLRVGAVNLLSKVFLRQLPLLRQYNPSAGFATTWLTVLKTLDRYMQIGVHLQRQQTAIMQAMHQARVNGHAHSRTHGPGAASSAGVPLSLLPVSGIDWSSESGLQLTESVAEALKNLVLVMKSLGVFNEHTQGETDAAAVPSAATQQLQLTTPAAATAASGSTRGPVPVMPAPNGELWSLTVGMLGPWLPFLPQLQAEITNSEQAEQQQQAAAQQNTAAMETSATTAAAPVPAATPAPAGSSAVPPHSSSPAAQRPPIVL